MKKPGRYIGKKKLLRGAFTRSATAVLTLGYPQTQMFTFDSPIGTRTSAIMTTPILIQSGALLYVPKRTKRT